MAPTWTQLGPICHSISVFARSCSKCKKLWQDCSFVDIRACRHGLQLAPGRSWEAMLTRCCLRRACAWAQKAIWSRLGWVLARPGRPRARSGPPLGALGPSLGPFRTSFRTPQTFKTQFGSNLDPTWTQLGVNLEPAWSQLGANLGPTWIVLASSGTISSGLVAGAELDANLGPTWIVLATPRTLCERHNKLRTCCWS